MLDSKELNEIEKNFSFINMLISGILLIYYFLCVWFDYETLGLRAVPLSALVICFIIEYVISKIDHMYSDFIYKIIKFCALVILSVMICNPTELVAGVIIYTLTYVMLSFQVMLTYDITDIYSIILSIIFSVAPLCLVMGYSMIFCEQDTFQIFVFIVFAVELILCLTNITKAMSYIVSNLYKKISELNDIASVSRRENNSMKSMQDRLVHANEQLSIQKFELQQANEKISMNNEEMKLQKEITSSFLESMDIQELPKIITNEIVKYLDCDIFSMNIVYTNDSGQLIRLHNTKCSNRAIVGEENIKKIESRDYVIDICNKGEVVRIDDFVNVNLEYFNGANIKSVIIVPAKFNNNILSTYTFGNILKNKYGDRDNFLKSLVNHITLSMSNAFLYYEMKMMAIKDPLTGIYNRRYFNTMNNEYEKEYISKGVSITVVLFDIDKFKSINDRYGHIFGDEVIRFCGKMADKYASSGVGMPVRYGGEEFVIVFPDKNIEEVRDICEMLHKDVKEKEFECNGEKVHIDVSIGIANYPQNGKSFKEIVNCADSAMYCSKKNGRGRITIYE
jgi:diguanylate cyclase (GGDEF)-like protein